MNFWEAKREFEIRLYLWAKSEWEREIEESFPNMRLFKSGTAWETLQFMLQLDRRKQIILSHALIKRMLPDATKALGECCSIEEQSLLSKRDDFFRIRGLFKHVQRLKQSGRTTEASHILQMFSPGALKLIGESNFNDGDDLEFLLENIFRPIPITLEEEIAAKSVAGEKVKYVSKRKLTNTLVRKFKSAFGSKCFGPEYLIKEPDPQFQMTMCGWILSTNFFVKKGRFGYSHDISSEDTFEHIGPHETYSKWLLIGQNISFGFWFGFSEWNYLGAEDVEAACNTMIKFCGYFFEIAPKLLKGLEMDKITKPIETKTRTI